MKKILHFPPDRIFFEFSLKENNHDMKHKNEVDKSAAGEKFDDFEMDYRCWETAD